MAKKINNANFPEGINLWVSDECKNINGKTTYWCTIDEYNDGELLYLAHSVWDDLAKVDSDTVLAVLCEGGFEIAEARDADGKTITTKEENGSVPIFQVQKSRKTSHGLLKA